METVLQIHLFLHVNTDIGSIKLLINAFLLALAAMGTIPMDLVSLVPQAMHSILRENVFKILFVIPDNFSIMESV
jgi:hypothetical protein